MRNKIIIGIIVIVIAYILVMSLMPDTMTTTSVEDGVAENN